jgi:peptidyl-Lys metalloendopeptidase
MTQGRGLWLGLALAVGFAGLAQAQGQPPRFESCEKTEIAAIEASIRGAHDLALQAAVQVGDTADYERWFGPYNRRGGDMLRRNLKSVYQAIVTEEISGQCLNGYQSSCKGGTYAFVNRNQPFYVNFCPPFFGLPTMIGVSPTSSEMENGTQEGTIIHELSHFEETANTDDLCYSRTECMEMARTDPNGALRNADSLQYYTEDVILYAAMASAP